MIPFEDEGDFGGQDRARPSSIALTQAFFTGKGILWANSTTSWKSAAVV
jgi:hypothetical protein